MPKYSCKNEKMHTYMYNKYIYISIIEVCFLLTCNKIIEIQNVTTDTGKTNELYYEKKRKINNKERKEQSLPFTLNFLKVRFFA